jgi:hypothetical protein
MDELDHARNSRAGVDEGESVVVVAAAVGEHGGVIASAEQAPHRDRLVLGASTTDQFVRLALDKFLRVRRALIGQRSRSRRGASGTTERSGTTLKRDTGKRAILVRVWIPTDAQEVSEAARAGRLTETPSFDAKADLPSENKNVELAKDVAAMATDGGVLLYGVAEDDNGQPTIPQPITLNGAAERVGQIVSTSIAEVPFIEVRPYPLSDDASRGFLAVIVPQSSRAPHMVVVKGDNRFYGRTANGNRILGEGDVARLYQRRQGWTVDRLKLLDEAIEHAPVKPIDGQAYVHAYARPVVLEPGMYVRAVERLGGNAQMHQRLIQCAHATGLAGAYSRTLEQASVWRRHNADLWRLSTRVESERSSLDDITSLVDLNLYLDGYARLFCGRASDTGITRSPTTPLIIEVVIAGNVEAFFAVTALLYDAAGYYGAVDVGVAVTGIEGAESERATRGFESGPPYPSARFSRTDRIAAAQLKDAPEVAQGLLHDLFDATTGIEGWNPWTQPQNR